MTRTIKRPQPLKDPYSATSATFEGVLMATQLHIGGGLALDGAKFLADVDFGGSGIAGPVSLAETTFSGFTSFAGCRFGGSARCSARSASGERTSKGSPDLGPRRGAVQQLGIHREHPAVVRSPVQQ